MSNVIDSDTLKERYWAMVDVRGRYDCWLWLGATTNDDYGTFYRGKTVDGRKAFVLAHRMGYELHFGEMPPPETPVVRHKCNTPRCQNPAHMKAGTYWDNVQDMIESGRSKFNHPGEDNGRAKLTEGDVREILRLGGMGELLQREIADIFGITQGNVSAILRGISWTHISREAELCPA